MLKYIFFLLVIIQTVLLFYTISCCSSRKDYGKNIIIALCFAAGNSILYETKLKEEIIFICVQVIVIGVIYAMYKEKAEKNLIRVSLFYLYNCFIAIIGRTVIEQYVINNQVIIEGHKLAFYMYLVMCIISAVVYLCSIEDICIQYTEELNAKKIMAFDFIIELFFMFVLKEIYSKQGNVVPAYAFIVGQLIIIGLLFLMNNQYREVNSSLEKTKEIRDRNQELNFIKEHHIETMAFLKQQYNDDDMVGVECALKSIIKDEGNSGVLFGESKNETFLNMSVSKAEAQGINVKIEASCDPLEADMNSMDLYRIITNIINNAIRALESRKENEEKRIYIKTYKEKNNIVILLGNNGPKIEDEVKKNIFKKGFTTKENKDESHGYGLNIVKELIEEKKGRISVESTNLTTEFKIILPSKKGVDKND